MKRRIYVVDDEEAIRRSTRIMLTIQGYDVTTFDCGTALLEALDGLEPGVILLDVRMPGQSGLEVQRELLARQCRHPVVVMTGHGDIAVAVAALQAGTVAFLEKPFSRVALDRALGLALAKLEDPARYRAALARDRALVEALGKAERAVLEGLTCGLSNEAIARDLGLTLQAVEASRAKLFTELGVESLPGALTLAFAADLAPNVAD